MKILLQILLAISLINPPKVFSQPCQVNAITSYSGGQCDGNNVTLIATGGVSGTYVWSCPTGTCPFTNTGTSLQNFSGYVANNGIYTVTAMCPDSSFSSDTTSIFVVPFPSVGYIGDFFGCEGTTGTITVTGGTAYPPYTYLWDIGLTTQSYTFQFGSNPYSHAPDVTVTNGYGCMNGNMYHQGIVSHPAPKTEIIPLSSTMICPGGTVSLSTQDTFARYEWSRNGVVVSVADTNRNYTAVGIGNYTVELTESTFGCTAITTPFSPVVSNIIKKGITVVGSLELCTGDTVKLYAYLCSGLSYQWKRNGINIAGATNSFYYVKNSGSYKVVITDQNAITTESVIKKVISVNLQPYATVNIVGSSTACQGSFVTLSSSQGTDFFYGWYNLNNGAFAGYNATTPIGSSGTYYVEVSDTNGCKAISSQTATITILPSPIATLTTIGSPNICPSSHVTFVANSGSGLTYQWNKDGQYLTADTNLSLITNQTGTYYVKVTDSNGCTKTSNTSTINVQNTISNIISTTGSNSICNGLLTLYAFRCNGSGYSYKWFKNGKVINGAAADSLNVATAGNYKVKITKSNGSSSFSPEKEIKVAPEVEIYSSIYTGNACPGQTINLQASNYDNQNNFNWFKDGVAIAGANTISLNTTTPGIYKLRATNPAGCINYSNNIKLTFDPAVANVNSPSGLLTFCSGDSLLLTANAAPLLQYQWKKNGIVIPGATNDSLYVKLAGTYRVTVTKVSTCSASSSGKAVTINCRTSQFNSDPITQITLAPNPSSAGFSLVAYDLTDRINIRIMDLQGRVVENLKNVNSNGVYGAGLLVGAYLVEISGAGLRERRVFVKQ